MTQQPRSSAPDPIGEFQRWLVRSGARGMSRELGGHLAGKLGFSSKSGDVWESATAPPPEEAPECAWCPVCRAARLLRESGPGLASHMASASDTLAGIVQEATSVVESMLSAASRRPGPAGGAAGKWAAGTGSPWDRAQPTAGEPGGAEWDLATHEYGESANGNGTGGHGADGNGAGGNGAGSPGAAGPGTPEGPRSPSSPE